MILVKQRKSTFLVDAEEFIPADFLEAFVGVAEVKPQDTARPDILDAGRTPDALLRSLAQWRHGLSPALQSFRSPSSEKRPNIEQLARPAGASFLNLINDFFFNGNNPRILLFGRGK